MELDKIITGDSAVVLQSFPPDCIDLSVQSPPYDNLRDYKGFTFDFEAIANQLYRVTKQGGICVWVVGDQTESGSESGTSFRQALYFMQCGFNLHDTMIYEKAGTLPSSNRYTQEFEFMFVFSKGVPKTFNPIMDRKNKWGGQKTFGKSSFRDKDGSLKVSGQREVNKIGKRSNIWRYANGFGFGQSDEIAYQHPATYPEALAQDHILSWSNEGDIVLDVFTGSGTTLKMAKMNNRHYLGIEISPEYVALAERRLLATPVPLFGQGRGLTLPAPDGGDSAPSQALSTPDMFSAIEHEPTPAPRR
jgi:site-specific DNA-methyltransferase (adenine-specific)